jgi:hypothetical protein
MADLRFDKSVEYSTVAVLLKSRAINMNKGFDWFKDF